MFLFFTLQFSYFDFPILLAAKFCKVMYSSAEQWVGARNVQRVPSVWNGD
jgi:hypothetical protein